MTKTKRKKPLELIDLFELPDRLLRALNARGFHTVEEVQARLGTLTPAEWLWRTAFMQLTWEDCEEFQECFLAARSIQ